MLQNLLLIAYTIGTVGAFLQIAGGYWDVSWHTLGLVETFFGPNHVLLYAGIVSILVAAFLGIVIRLSSKGESFQKSLLTGLNIALVGVGMQVIAGPADFWWHTNFGFDPFLFTPSHTLLIAGIILNGIGMAVGNIRLLQLYGTRSSAKVLLSQKWLQLLAIIALTTLWLDLNTAVYLVLDVNGIAYTFHLGDNFVKQTTQIAFAIGATLVSATGTLVFFITKRVFAWRGALTVIALLSAFVSATANLGFRAMILGAKDPGPQLLSFIPLYLSFMIPVFLFDLWIGNANAKWKTLLASGFIAPFASYLDGWYAFNLWMRANQMILILMTPMLIAGLIAGMSSIKLTNRLASREIAMLTATSDLK